MFKYKLIIFFVELLTLIINNDKIKFEKNLFQVFTFKTHEYGH